MAKSKQKINEDILQMGRLMNYNRGLTSTENTVLFENNVRGKKKLNEGMLDDGIEFFKKVGIGLLAPIAAVAWPAAKVIKKAVTAIGDSSNFSLGTTAVGGLYLFETEPFQAEGVDLLDSTTVQEIVTAFYDAGEVYGGGVNRGTDEDAVYRLVKACETVVGLSQVAEEYQATYGSNLGDVLIDEMEEDTAELNKMYSIAERLPLLSFNGTEIKDLTVMATIIDEYKKKKAGEVQEKYAPDFSLITINGNDLPFDYEMTMEAQAKFDEYIKNTKYINKWSPEFLAAQAIAKTARQEIEVGYPGDGKKVVEAEVEDEFAMESHKRKLGLTEGTVTGDGSGNIVNKKTNPEKNTDDNSGGDKNGSKSKSSGRSSWKRAPDSEPTKGDKSTFVSKGHYNKNEGSVVKRIQKALGIKEDGLYGPATKAAVEKYQKENGLDVNGVVGYDTWVKMSASTDKLGKSAEGMAGAKEVAPKAVEVIKKEITTDSDAQETLKHLQDITDTKFNETQCIQLVVAANGALPKVAPEILPKLQACFYDYNFPPRIGRRAVKKAYNITGKGKIKS